VEIIQQRNLGLLQRAGGAVVALIDAVKTRKARGATPEELAPALELQRKAQWRLDFVAAENSMGFHAPQETARLLGEAIDYARQGELVTVRAKEGGAEVVPAGVTTR
jgi:nitrite reductase (cytochrome c-552)